MPINLFVGMLLGFAGGVGAVLWSELRDERVFSAATITKVSGFATVAILKSTAN
jgi:capsular polysaccharide biosynthesis protein